MLHYTRLFLCTALVAALDQLSKTYIAKLLEFNTYFYPPAVPVWEPWLYAVHIGNKGAAWGLLDGKAYWLGLLGIVFILGLYFMRKEIRLRTLPMQYCFGLICGGVIGNIWDRMSKGYVVDFIDIHIGESYRFPAFNFADSVITLGIVWYILYSLFQKKA